MTTVTVVIPAFNEAGRIGSTVRSVLPFVDEVLVIDDGSTDPTALEAERAGALVVRQPQNLGYIAAIKAGFAGASGQVIVTVDADGEMPVECIPDLVRPVIDGQADMVQGRRDFIPRPSERFLTWLAAFRGPVGDSGSGFRALDANLARSLELNGVCICGIFALEVLAHGGRISEIPVRLVKINKPRRVAWYHIRQFFYLLPWLISIANRKISR